jgi:uncharacterized membrane protein
VQGGKLVLAGPLYRTTTLDVQARRGGGRIGGGNNRILRADTLTIATGAKVDLRDNKLITKSPIGTFTGGAYTGVQGDVARRMTSDRGTCPA